MATIGMWTEMWSIKYMALVAGWLLLPPVCHLHQDYHNRILLGMRQRMRIAAGWILTSVDKFSAMYSTMYV